MNIPTILCIALIYLLSASICVSNSLELFPPCQQPLNKTIRVNRGEDIVLNFSLIEISRQSNTHWQGTYLWINENDGHATGICRPFYGNCNSQIDRLQMSVSWLNATHLIFDFSLIIYRDEIRYKGNHVLMFLQDSSYQALEKVCSLFRVHITVVEPGPFCSTSLTRGRHQLELSCSYR